MHATLIATDAQVAYFKETYAVWKRQGFPCADARMLPLLEIINSLDGLSSVYCCEGHPASNRSGQTKASRFYILLAATEVGHTHMAQITYNLRTLLKSQVAAKENCAYEPSKLALKYCEMVAMATDERPLEFFFYNAVIFEGGTTNDPKIKSKFLKSFLSVLQEYASTQPSHPSLSHSKGNYPMNTVQFKNTLHPFTHQALKDTPAVNALIKQITIDITGSRPHIGKTLLAGVIARALADAGFTNVTVNAPEGGVDATSHNIVERTIDDAILSNEVVINDLNAPKFARGMTDSFVHVDGVAYYRVPVSNPGEPFRFNPFTGEKRNDLDVTNDPYYAAWTSEAFLDMLKSEKSDAKETGSPA